jgi:Calcineurin-like phosphoesterase
VAHGSGQPELISEKDSHGAVIQPQYNLAMPTSPNFKTFRDPAFSLWQSAIHSTLLKHAAQGTLKTALTPGQSGLAVTADHPFMVASVQAMQGMQSGPPAQPAASVAGTVLECAKLAAEIAWDDLFDQAKVPALKNELTASTCDPFWAECLVVYEASLVSGGAQTYIGYTNLSDYVLSNCFPDTAKIAIIGDWGTGMSDALVLLQQIAANFQPDVLIHLGDVYYAGMPSEDTGHFSALIGEVWPANPPLVFTLDGNHDRYAGTAGGYYPLIANLNASAKLPQPNSYFALRNNFWQFVAMDTGYHDTDPFTVNSNVTYLEPTEIAWHLDKIKNNGVGVDTTKNPSAVRGTVLLSHHQLVSFTGVGEDAAGQALAVNQNLADAFSPVFNLIDFWLWGHEHDLCIFEPYSNAPGQPLPPGRCVGASAVPIFTPAAAPPEILVIPECENARPQIVPGTALANNGTVFNHAYAIATLTNAGITIDYYQVDSSDATPGKPPAPTLVYSDKAAGPLAAGLSGQMGKTAP